MLAGLLFGALQAGSVQLLATTTTPQDLVEHAAVGDRAVHRRAGVDPDRFRLRASRGGVQQLAKGWNG